MRQGLCNGTVSVRPSVRLSVPARAHSSESAAAGPGGQEISIDCCSGGVRRAGSATLSAYVGPKVTERRRVLREGDSLTDHRGQEFSTLDADTDSQGSPGR